MAENTCQALAGKDPTVYDDNTIPNLGGAFAFYWRSVLFARSYVIFELHDGPR